MKHHLYIVLLLLFTTTTQAQTWNSLTVPGPRNLNSCWFDISHPDTGMAVGWYLQAFDLIPFSFNTSDGGNTITSSSLFQVYFYAAQDVTFTNSYNGIVVGNGILQTTNGGSTWNIVEDAASMQGGRLFNIMFSNGTDGYAVGQRYDFNFQLMEGMLYKTTNGGGSWINSTVTQEALNENTELHAVYSTGNGVIYAGASNYVGGASTLFKSTDDGVTWNPLSFTSNVWSLHFISADTGFAATESGLLKTTNAGLSWANILNTTSALHTVHIRNNFGFAAGVNGSMYQTNDNGLTWATLSSGVVHTIERVFVVSQNLAYAVGDSGTFLKYTNTTGMPDAMTEMPEFQVQLTADHNLHIRLKTNANTVSKLELFNSHGALIKNESFFTLNNSIQDKQLAIPSAVPGMYLLRLTSGQIQITKKIVLPE